MKWPLLLFLLFPILLDSSSFAQSPKETPEQYKARICSDAAYDDTGLLKQECERMGGQLSPPAKQEIAPSGDAGSKSDQKKQQDQFGMSDSDYLKAFVIAILLGLIPAFIARNRGHSFTFWWIFGALALVVALPWSLFLKDRESEIKGAN